MKRILIDEAEPGMTLAKPVSNAAGLPFLPTETILDAGMIERLAKMGLTSIFVECGPESTTGGKTLAELESELAHRFRRVIHDPLQQTIHDALRAHLRRAHGIAEHSEGTPPA